MSQDVVTARDAAVPAATSLRFPEAQPICALLDAALAIEGVGRATYAIETQSVLQQAWAVAAHKHSTQVTIFHLAYALVFDQPQYGEKLAEHLGTDVDTFAVGCILQILALGVSTGDADLVQPAVGTVRWVGEAAAHARDVSSRLEVQLGDFVATVLSHTLPASELRSLRRAARVGNARRDTVLGTKPVHPIAGPSPAPRDIIEHLQEVERGSGPLPDAGNSSAELLALLEEIQQRQGIEFAEQKATLARIAATSESAQAHFDQRLAPVGDLMGKLNAIDHRVAAIQNAQPRPPSGMRLSAAIVAVLILGTAAGLVLASFSPGSRLTQSLFAIIR